MAGNTCLHCGKRVRLPIITYSRMLLPNEASTAACPADCNTVQINPNAMSSLEASALALPKSEATASMGSPGNGWALMSPISRLMLPTLPLRAISNNCLISSVLSSRRASPCKVPPPIPIPPMCEMSSPSHFTNDVPVPMLTTMIRSRPDS